jgi:cytochrome d ubiquinol oxidase subunit I
VIKIDPIAAMLNPSTPSEVSHVLSSAYVTCGFLLAAIAAYHLLKGKTHDYYKKALRLTMITSFILALLTFIAGDLSGKFLADYQPAKLAAGEWHFETRSNAPLVIGGILDEKTLTVKYGLEIPSALSFLATGSFFGKVTGLKDIPRSEWPPLFVHYLFDAMVGIGFYLILISAVFLVSWWIKKEISQSPWLLRGIVLAAPLAFLAIEFGWIYAEVGRQPWIITGLMRVDQAATTADNVGTVTLMFSLLYLLLAIVAVSVLFRLFKGRPAETELQTPGERGERK